MSRWDPLDLAGELRVLTSTRGLSVAEAAAVLGVSRTTAYKALEVARAASRA